jgi:hypothetical protein
MKIEIFGEESNKICRLKLERGVGSVDLIEVDEKGEPLVAGYICRISSEGIMLHSNYCGALPTNKYGEVQVVTVHETKCW